MNTAEAMLAISFPPDRGYHGATTTIADLSNHGLPRPGFIGSKFEAVNLIVRVNLGRNRARGLGSKARRRLAGMVGTKMRAVRATPSQRAADAASETITEGRIHRNTRPQRHE